MKRQMAMWSVVSAGLVLTCFVGAGKQSFGLEADVDQEVRNVLSTCMEQVRQRAPDECARVDAIRKRHGVALVPYLEEYITDPNHLVRWQAYAWLILVGVDANDLPARQAVVYRLLARLREDEWLGNRQYLANRLTQLTSGDFSEGSRELLHELFRGALGGGDGYVRRDIILLVGVADMKSELPHLKEFIEANEEKLKQQHEMNLATLRQNVAKMQEPLRAFHARALMKQYWQSSLVWAAFRARARIGVKEDIERCIELAESHPDEDYRVGWLLQELSYVRQPEVVDYLHQYLESHAVRQSKGRDTIGGTYAHLAAKALAHMLRGFPGDEDVGGDRKTIEKCRKWMAEQKEWDIIR